MTRMNRNIIEKELISAIPIKTQKNKSTRISPEKEMLRRDDSRIERLVGRALE